MRLKKQKRRNPLFEAKISKQCYTGAGGVRVADPNRH